MLFVDVGPFSFLARNTFSTDSGFWPLKMLLVKDSGPLFNDTLTFGVLSLIYDDGLNSLALDDVYYFVLLEFSKLEFVVYFSAENCSREFSFRSAEIILCGVRIEFDE